MAMSIRGIRVPDLELEIGIGGYTGKVVLIEPYNFEPERVMERREDFISLVSAYYSLSGLRVNINPINHSRLSRYGVDLYILEDGSTLEEVMETLRKHPIPFMDVTVVDCMDNDSEGREERTSKDPRSYHQKGTD